MPPAGAPTGNPPLRVVGRGVRSVWSRAMADVIRNQRTSRPHLAVARALRRRQTPAEQRLWQHLRAGQLDGHRFRRQQPLGPYIADFYCVTARLIIELDGPIHETQREYDRERDAYLAAHDLRILRFPNAAILDDLEGVLRIIRHAPAPP